MSSDAPTPDSTDDELIELSEHEESVRQAELRRSRELGIASVAIVAAGAIGAGVVATLTSGASTSDFVGLIAPVVALVGTALGFYAARAAGGELEVRVSTTGIKTRVRGGSVEQGVGAADPLGAFADARLRAREALIGARSDRTIVVRQGSEGTSP
jgi:hypothetical protein